MAEFLRRGYNVAIPEVDVGEDIFVIRDQDGNLSRIQVKVAMGRGKRKVRGTFKVPLPQLLKFHEPELHYVFTVHHHQLWREFVVIPREVLRSLHDGKGIGNMAQNNLILYLSFTDGDVQCGQISLQVYRGNWSNWPVIQH
jgi:hypothetical protein